MARNDWQLAGADLELAEILIIIGATEAVGLDTQQTVVQFYLGQSEFAACAAPSIPQLALLPSLSSPFRVE